jgi:bla regulator protein BlaR1
MMETLLGLALKSLLIAGITLGLLHLTRKRSASERSLIAHLGLLALVALPLASLMLPSLNIPVPDALRPAPAIEAAASPAPASDNAPVVDPTRLDALSNPVVRADEATGSGFDWTPYAYATPAIALLLITLMALLRLVALRSRAQILVDPTWLTALAHAQRRMGFKNGTALLTSNELSSPISWGLVRPVILLNEEALEARGEAEAIIAHELAHVARLDWAKLMLARVATAIFWFNPLAWVLAREAHQLREEAADDAVLAANIDGADYAQLLVGVARHECKGLLLGAHGVAPGKGSLRRRVGRVLDGTLTRAPATKSWMAGFGAGMLVMAAPLAALTLGPKAEDKLTAKDVVEAEHSAQVNTAAAGPVQPADVFAEAAEGTIQNRQDGSTVMRSADGATMTLFAPDASGRRKLVMRSADGAVMSFADARQAPGFDAMMFARTARNRARDDRRHSAIDQAIAMKAVGVTPEYLAGIRRAAPHLGVMDGDDVVELRAVGVTPEYIREMSAAGFGKLDKDELVEARAVGVTGAYIRSLAAAGIRGSIDDYVQLRALGVNARDARSGLSMQKLIKLKEGEIDPFDGNPPEPPDVDPDPDPNE